MIVVALVVPSKVEVPPGVCFARSLDGDVIWFGGVVVAQNHCHVPLAGHVLLVVDDAFLVLVDGAFPVAVGQFVAAADGVYRCLFPP